MGKPSSPATTTDWASCLRAEHDALQSFLEVLENEQRTLLSGQTETLIDLADQKTRLVEQLTRLAEQRRKLQPAPGVTPADQEDGASRQLWTAIRQMAARAEQLNHTNGELIQIKLRHNQQALTVLHNAAQSATLYGPDGQASIPVAGRTLGSV
jgi:flagella synthesis protein FlgN